MAYEKIQIWDGVNNLGLTNGQLLATVPQFGGINRTTDSIDIKDTGTPGTTVIFVGTSQLQAVSSNANRKMLIFQNVSANPIFVNWGITANVNQGTLIGASGYPPVVFERYVPTSAINAIASGATATLLITEGL